MADEAPRPKKTERTEVLKAIKAGATDRVGNKVIHVLAAGDEYVIYEIDHPDINYRLRVTIDAATDEDGKIVVDRFARIKQKYIEAKGLLYKTSNYDMMKNRVVHALSTALSTDAVDAENEFDSVILTIIKEINESAYKRVLYIIPSIIFYIIAALFLILHVNGTLSSFGVLGRDFPMVAIASSSGCCLSVLFSAQKLRFDDYSLKWYFIIGIERVFISWASSSIAYMLIRSKLILPQIADTPGSWSMMPILVVAAFSEALVPSILSRLEKKVDPPAAR